MQSRKRSRKVTASLAEKQEENKRLVLAASARFQSPMIDHKVFLNSLPKSGTYLLRNILAMFTAPSQIYLDAFVLDHNFDQHVNALFGDKQFFFNGHLNFDPNTFLGVRNARHVLLVRDPYDYVLSYARFLMSEGMDVPIAQHIRKHNLGPTEVMRIVIFGSGGDKYFAPLEQVYSRNVVQWLGTGCKVVKTEDLLAATAALNAVPAEVFFRDVTDFCGLAWPQDWRVRVKAGSDPALSLTSRQAVSTPQCALLPAELGPIERALVGYAAPGLRQLLGYL